MKRSNSSHRWLQEHRNDPYVKLAKKQGIRSRAAFKLKELQEKYRIVKAGDMVVDLGAAPGSWSQLLAEWVGERGRVFALDLLPMDALVGVDFIQGDFSEEAVLKQLLEYLQGEVVDLVFSDIAPNMSGIKIADQARAMYLAELVLDFAQYHLIEEGSMLIKVFQGEGFDAYLTAVRKMFKKVSIHKPDASRDRSREVYILALLKL
jgi:23S rRNA (uridine2552-2'-O)-methyltransferase